MEATKLQVKYFLQTNGSALELHPFIPVFHGWIRNRTLDELMIDVVDYAHVPNGPGVALIGHGSDYYLDVGEGRPGLLYSRKRQGPNEFSALLRDAFSRALKACRLIEQDDTLAHPARFRTDEILVRLPDRLHAPNTPETLAAVRPELEQILAKLYAGAKVELESWGNPQQPFGVRVRVSEQPSLDSLIAKLD
jgi:hypothetical protein